MSNHDHEGDPMPRETGPDKDLIAELDKGNIPVPGHDCAGDTCWCTQRPFPNS